MKENLNFYHHQKEILFEEEKTKQDISKLMKHITFEEASKVKWIILPSNKIKHYWDLYIGVLLIYIALALPYIVCFDIDRSDAFSMSIDILVDLSFFFDIILTFFTAIKVNDFVIVCKKEIAKTYLRGWFFLDLLTTIPF